MHEYAAPGEDVDMTDLNKYSIKGGRKVIVGSAELGYKRDMMEIQPLFHDNGISKILTK